MGTGLYPIEILPPGGIDVGAGGITARRLALPGICSARVDICRWIVLVICMGEIVRPSLLRSTLMDLTLYQGIVGFGVSVSA